MKLKKGCILSAMVLLVTGLLLVEPVCAKSEPGVRVDKWIRSHFANPDHLSLMGCHLPDLWVSGNVQ